MTTPQPTEAADTSLGRDLVRAARYYLGGRRGLLALALVAVVAGIALNWNWLVATGIAPILLTGLPCLVMCGAGLCMNKLVGGGSCQSPPANSDQFTDPTSKRRDTDA
jgi:hypothetical protein